MPACVVVVAIRATSTTTEPVVSGPRDTDLVRTIAVACLAIAVGMASLTGCVWLGRGSDEAAKLLAEAPTPPEATQVSGLPGDQFSHPAMRPACDPLHLQTTYWTTSLNGPAVQEYLRTHPGADLRVSGTGIGTDKGTPTSWQIMLAPKTPTAGRKDGPSQKLVVYQVASFGSGVGIRIDAEVVPPDASCTRS